MKNNEGAQAAPYPDDTRAKGWRFELDHERIKQSDTWALAPPAVRPWLLMLWMTAWEQTPCGSLPSDDDLIIARLGIDPDFFALNRGKIMRGWVAASNGRLYHQHMTKLVLAMIERRAMNRRCSDGGYRGHFAEVTLRFGACCVYCGFKPSAEDEPLTLDHVMPRSRGGSDEVENLVPACRSCNSSKGARTPEEWAATRGNSR